MIIQMNDKSVEIRAMLIYIYRHLATYGRRSQLGHLHRSSRRDKLELSVPPKNRTFSIRGLILTYSYYYCHCLKEHTDTIY